MAYGSITTNYSGRYEITVMVPITGGIAASVTINLPLQTDFQDTEADNDKAVQALLDVLGASFTVSHAHKYYDGNQPITTA